MKKTDPLEESVDRQLRDEAEGRQGTGCERCCGLSEGILHDAVGTGKTMK